MGNRRVRRQASRARSGHRGMARRDRGSQRCDADAAGRSGEELCRIAGRSAPVGDRGTRPQAPGRKRWSSPAPAFKAGSPTNSTSRGHVPCSRRTQAAIPPLETAVRRVDVRHSGPARPATGRTGGRTFDRRRRCRRCRRKFRSGCPPICSAAARTCARPNGNWRPRPPASAWRKRNGSPNFPSPGTSGRKASAPAKWFEPGSLFWSLGPSVQWRTLDFGRVRAEVRAQTAVQEAALATYEKVALTSLQEAENAVVAYAQEQNRHTRARRRSGAKPALAGDGQRVCMPKGASIISTSSMSRRSLYQSDDELAVSDQAVSLDLIALYKALGGGWETMTREPADAAGVIAMTANAASRAALHLDGVGKSLSPRDR